MAIGGPSFSSQQTENPSSDLNSSGTRNQAARVQPNPQEVVVVPIENVNRIMRSVLPSDVQIEEDSTELMAEFASTFMRHMIEEASHRCQQERREVVTGDDITDAMTRFELQRQAAEAINIANAARAIVPQQDPRNHEPVDVPMAPATPPHVAAYRAPMLGALSGDEGSDGSDDETSNESFIHVENLNRRSNFSG